MKKQWPPKSGDEWREAINQIAMHILDAKPGQFVVTKTGTLGFGQWANKKLAPLVEAWEREQKP